MAHSGSLFVGFVTLLLTALMLAVGAKGAWASNTVAVSPSAGSVAMGSSLAYTISIAPSGGNPAVMTDQVNGMSGLVVSTSSGSCTQSAGLVTCQTSLAQATTVTISGTVTAPAGTVLHDVAVLAPQAGQPVSFASAEADVQVTGGTVAPGPGSGTPDLVTSIVAPSTVPAGTPLTYTLVVGNQGTGNANNVNVVDTLPPGLTSPSVTNTTSLFQCAVSGQTVTCLGGRIDAGADAEITITGGAPASGTLTDQAVVDPFDTIPESNYNNNTSQAQTTVAPNPAANALGVSLSASPTPDVAQGERLTYTIKVTNNQPTGGASISDIGLSQPTQGLDPASIAISFTLPPGQSQNVAQACGVTDATVQCFSADNDSAEVSLSPGQTMTVTVSGTVVAPPAQKVFEAATVVGGLSNPNQNSLSTTATTSTQVKPAIDLSITKASLAPTVNAAAPFQYQYVVGNSGLSTATGVVVRDPLPAAIQEPHGGYTFSVPFGSGFMCSIDSSKVLTCSGGTVAAQSTATITVGLIAPEATGAYTSVVQVDPNDTIPESDKSNNTASATTTVTTGVDLCVAPIPPTVPPDPTNCGLTATQSVNNNPVAPNGTLTYTIPVANQGTQDVTGVEVDDTLPVGTIFRSAKGDHNFTCSDQGATVKCVGGIIKGTYSNFPSGVDTATITINVFAPAAPGKLMNVVRVDPNNAIPEIDKENNISSLTTEVELGTHNGEYIELHFNSLTSTPLGGASKESVAPNGTVTYAMVVANTGTEQAFNVEVQDTLPAGARYISATGTGGFECSDAGAVVTCTGGGLAPNGMLGSTQQITITAFAPPTPGTYTDQAIVDPNHEIPEANETNNSDTVETVVAVPEYPKNYGGSGTYIDLAVKEITSPTPPVLPDGLVTYTVIVTDAGSAKAATNVETDDSLPANATFVSAKGTDGDTCELAADGRTVKCLGATIPSGGTDEITIKVQAPNESSGEPGGLVALGPDEAIVNPNNEIPESDTENNTAKTEPVEVKSKVNLKIEQSGPDTASQNDTPSYTLTVENEGEETARGVVVRDPLPVGLIVQNVASEPNNFACKVYENPVNVIECTGALKAKEKATITIGTFVTAADSTKLTNEACVNPDRTIVEYNYTDNCSTMVIGVNEPDLSVSQSASVSPVSPGGKEVYTIDVENIGTGKAEGSKMEDKLPTGEKFVSANGTNGTTCKEASGTVTCELGKGGELAPNASTTITLTVEVEEGATGPIENTAEATTTTSPAVTSHNKATTKVSVNATGIDLAAVSIMTNQDPVNQGAVLTYTSVIKNLGVENAKNVLIRQELPTTGVSFISASASGGFTCSLVGTNVECEGSALNAGAMTTITTNVQVTAKGPASLTSTIIADPKHEIKESNNTNQSKSITTSVTGATCTKCFDDVMGPISASPSPVKTKDELTYSFGVGNSGDEPAPTPNTVEPGVVITDKLDENVEFVEGSATNGFKVTFEAAEQKVFVFEEQCKLLLGSVICPKKEPSTLAAGAGVIVTVKTKVKEPGKSFPFFVENTALVEPLLHEFNVTNNEATNEVEVTGTGPLVRGLAAPTSGLTSAGGATPTSTAAAHQASCRLPSFRHMTKNQARRALTKAKCGEVVARFRGKGARVVRQAIRPGMVIGKRTVLILRLGRA